MHNIKQTIKIRGEMYDYQGTYISPVEPWLQIKGKYPLEGNPDYTGIKVVFRKGNKLPRTMWNTVCRRPIQYEWVEYASRGDHRMTKHRRRR